MTDSSKVKIIEIDENEPAPLNVPGEVKGLRGKSVYIAVPAFGCLVHNGFAGSLLALQIEAIKRGVPVYTDMLGNESLIQRARNMLVARFLKSPATHLLFIDGDISFSPETVFRMLSFDKPVVSCAYPKKMHDMNKVCEKVLAGDEEATASISSCGLDYNINLTQSVTAENGFVRVHDAATGFLLLSRDAVKKVCEAYDPQLRVVNDIISSREEIPEYVDIFECIHDDVGEGKKRLLSEDYSFSRKCQAVGLDVYMDIASVIAHHGNMMCVGNIRDRFKMKVTYELD